MNKDTLTALIHEHYDENPNLFNDLNDMYTTEKDLDIFLVGLGKKVMSSLSQGDTSQDRRVKKKVKTRFGEIDVKKQHAWFSNLDKYSCSPYFKDVQVYMGQEDNYELACSRLSRLLHVDCNSSQMERLTQHYGGISEDLLNACNADALSEILSSTLEEEKTYFSIDGSMIQTREGDNGNDWKEAKLARIYNSKDKYEADKHHNCISKSIYRGHFGGKDGFLEKIEPLAEVLEKQGHFVFLSDGAPWIWKWMETRFSNYTGILDYYHVMEHIAAFAKSYLPDKEARKVWLEEQKDRLFNDKVEDLLGDLSSLDFDDNIQKHATDLHKYLSKHKERMRYGTFRSKGFDIGSGAMESAHRTVIQKRMKQSGQRWTRKGGQHILALRVIEKNGLWDKLVEKIINPNKSQKVAA